jgi:uncharacterized protein YjgD (DUF1641 family)
MISLKDYILENIDPDNLVWKIEVYFKNHKDQYTKFVNLTKKFEENHGLTDDEINDFLDKSKLNLKKFIDFISEDVTTETIDYMYTLRKVIQNLLDDKTINL